MEVVVAPYYGDIAAVGSELDKVPMVLRTKKPVFTPKWER